GAVAGTNPRCNNRAGKGGCRALPEACPFHDRLSVAKASGGELTWLNTVPCRRIFQPAGQWRSSLPSSFFSVAQLEHGPPSQFSKLHRRRASLPGLSRITQSQS